MRDERVVRVLTLTGRAARGYPTPGDALSAALRARLRPEPGAEPLSPAEFKRWPLRVEHVRVRGRRYYWAADDMTPVYALYAPVAHVRS